MLIGDLIMYQLITDELVKRIADNAFIPFDLANSDYQAYLAWLAKGNKPLPASEPQVQSTGNEG